MPSSASDLYDTAIPVLGESRVPSPLRGTTDDAVARIDMTVDAELAEDFIIPRALSFELAGPRSSLYFDPGKCKAAVVSCGGICPGINDVIRSLVNACNSYGIPSVLGIRHGLRGFIPHYRLDVLELTAASVADIHEHGGTVLGTSRGPQPVEQIADALDRLNVTMLFCIGGDGSMKAAAAIDAELRRRNRRIAVIGIPKTIDNDINFIPRTFGFETAVDRAAEAIHCALAEARSVTGGIGIIKLMGRESGFIAAQATLAARDVAFTLVPEVPFCLEGEEGLLRALEKRLAGHGYAVIVAAEGAGQHLFAESGHCDASGNTRFGDIGELLMREIGVYCTRKSIPYYFKYIDPSYTIRSVPADAGDRIYCTLLGQHAVHAAMGGKTGMVVAKIMDRFVHLPLSIVTRKRRTMSPGSDLWRAVSAATGQGALCATTPFSGEAIPDIIQQGACCSHERPI